LIQIQKVNIDPVTFLEKEKWVNEFGVFECSIIIIPSSLSAFFSKTSNTNFSNVA
jgi:hypothetical protein